MKTAYVQRLVALRLAWTYRIELDHIHVVYTMKKFIYETIPDTEMKKFLEPKDSRQNSNCRTAGRKLHFTQFLTDSFYIE